MKKDADIAARFGLRVRELRKAKGLSQEAFAAACGLDRTYISGIERGRRNVSLRNIEVIADALGVSISELMKGLSGRDRDGI
jgi:transcriptional regulator with XRE-family HTH domain